MYSAARRRERRQGVIDELRKYYCVTGVVDYSAGEERGHWLEGTGSLVLDHVQKIAYASLSQRTRPEVLQRFCSDEEITREIHIRTFLFGFQDFDRT